MARVAKHKKPSPKGGGWLFYLSEKAEAKKALEDYKNQKLRNPYSGKSVFYIGGIDPISSDKPSQSGWVSIADAEK